MSQTILTISTNGPGLYEFTAQAVDFAARGTRTSLAADGLLTVFVRHTTCSLLIQENADPAVQRDLDAFFRRLVPPASDAAMGWVTHRTEGSDDMPAHIKAAMMSTTLCIPVGKGKLMLGKWQGIFLFEHRDKPHNREIVLRLST